MKSHEFDVTSKKMLEIARFVSGLTEGEMVHTAAALLISVCETFGYKGVQGYYKGQKNQKWKFILEDADNYEVLEVFFNHIS